jgi:serine/threonine protein kinase
MTSELAAGAVVAGFRVESLVGHGAMARVYRARDEAHDRVVALKILDEGLARDERFRQRFLRESQLAASLTDPHIVRTLGSGEEDGQLYLAMEYIDGSDLRQLLRQDGRLEPQRTIDLVGQVASALDTAHAAGLIHRDVKPGNILVGSDAEGEHAYVCDFGLARHVSSVSSLTGERGFVGTIDYVPPEQIQGGVIDSRTDVYSLGCVLFECLAGARPFERESELSVVFAHLNEPPPRISELRPDLPAAFDRVFAAALAKAPEDRHQSCGELAEAARAASQGKVLSHRKSRRRRWQASAAILAIAGAALGALLVTRSEHSGVIAPTGQTGISQTAIAGTKLGNGAAYYTHLLGPFRKSTLDGPGYPYLTFQQPEMAVYFPTEGTGAIVITTWNKHYRTSKGIGPCSTIAAMKKAYGSAVKRSEYSLVKGGIAFSYVVGDNLVFATSPKLRKITAVALYRGPPLHTGVEGTPEAFAGFIADDETPCITG